MIKIINFYRGKRKDNGKWVTGFLYITHNGEYELKPYDNEYKMERMSYVIDLDTLNELFPYHKDVYTGDIVKYEFMNKVYIGEVCFGAYEQDGSRGEYSPSTCLGCYVKRHRCILQPWEDETDIPWIMNNYTQTISLIEAENLVVIGNVIDNIELLKCN